MFLLPWRQTVTAFPSHTCCVQPHFKALISCLSAWGMLSFPFFIPRTYPSFHTHLRSCVSHLLLLWYLFSQISICISVRNVLCSRYLRLAWLGKESILWDHSIFIKVLVTQLCPTLCFPMDWSPPASSVHGILQAGILERVAISFSGVTSRCRDRTLVSCIIGGFFTSEPAGKARIFINTFQIHHVSVSIKAGIE